MFRMELFDVLQASKLPAVFLIDSLNELLKLL